MLVARARDVLYLGRGTAYPLALEGALKLKELSYIHAEGYAAGELKHGPIALIDEAMPVIVIAPRDAVFEKTLSNMQEVAARGGRIVLIGEKRAAEEAGVAIEHFLAMPEMGANFAPIVYAAPIQMLAYHTAVIMGKDADQPRNLAKSVTVDPIRARCGDISPMCGIVGVLGRGPVAGPIVEALKQLEYRGYNSAGVATLDNGRLERRRAEGKLKNLEAKL